MAIEKREIDSNFVGLFKVGDNLVSNCSLLCSLVEANTENQLNKAIVIQTGSIIEASLGQIIFRAQNFNREGVPRVSVEDQAVIAEKKIDKLNSIIDVMKKYKILDPLGATIYDELHKLRKYRNKVHIQDDIDIEGVSRDEDVAFSSDVQTWALRLNEKVLTYLGEHLKRPKELEGYVRPLTVPSV